MPLTTYTWYNFVQVTWAEVGNGLGKWRTGNRVSNDSVSLKINERDRVIGKKHEVYIYQILEVGVQRCACF